MPLHTMLLLKVFDCLDHFFQDLDGGWHCIKLPSTMVRDKDAIDSIFKGKNSVSISHDSFGKDWKARLSLDKVYDLPFDVVVLVILHEFSQGRVSFACIDARV